MNSSRILVSVLALSVFAGCYLPDHGDHSKCAPDQAREIELSAARAYLTDAGAESGEWVPYSVSQGRALVEADILIGEAAELERTRAIVTTGRIWPKGVVPYRIHEELVNPSRIHRAMRDWEKKTGGAIRFIPASGHKDYVEFVKAEGCWSYVGRVGGRQEIGLAAMCGLREVKHEIGHALGLWHEQSRSDRDLYVDVKWCNIEEEHRHNFFRRTVLARDIGPYNYLSIMHYPRGAFSTNNRVSLQSKTDQGVSHWNRRKISAGDVAAILELYGR